MANKIQITEEKIKTEKITQYIKCFEAEENGRFKCLVGDCDSIVSNSSASIRHLKSLHKNIAEAIDGLKKEQLQDGLIEVKFRANPVKVWNAIMDIIVFGAIPFTILKSTGFRYFIDPFINAFRSSGLHYSVNRINTQSKIEEKAEQMKQIISKEINGRLICLLLDIASRYNRSILGINIAYFYNGKVRVRTIGMHSLKISQTARNLYDIVRKRLTEFGITIEQVFAVTTDNGKNLIKLSKLIKSELSHCNENDSDEETDIDECEDENEDDINLPTCENPSGKGINEYSFDTEIFNEEYFRDLLVNVRKEFDCQYDGLFSGISCAAHGLHLIVTKALKKCTDMDDLILKVRTLVKKLRTPNLRGALNEYGEKSALLDVKTRWSSIYNMVNNETYKSLRKLILNSCLVFFLLFSTIAYLD